MKRMRIRALRFRNDDDDDDDVAVVSNCDNGADRCVTTMNGKG